MEATAHTLRKSQPVTGIARGWQQDVVLACGQMTIDPPLQVLVGRKAAAGQHDAPPCADRYPPAVPFNDSA
jgi:hypothetical protein